MFFILHKFLNLRIKYISIFVSTLFVCLNFLAKAIQKSQNWGMVLWCVASHFPCEVHRLQGFAKVAYATTLLEKKTCRFEFGIFLMDTRSFIDNFSLLHMTKYFLKLEENFLTRDAKKTWYLLIKATCFLRMSTSTVGTTIRRLYHKVMMCILCSFCWLQGLPNDVLLESDYILISW